eukprot:4299989-Amphidinium_carterae.1
MVREIRALKTGGLATQTQERWQSGKGVALATFATNDTAAPLSKEFRVSAIATGHQRPASRGPDIRWKHKHHDLTEPRT